MASTRLLYDNCNSNYYCKTTKKVGDYMTSNDQSTNNDDQPLLPMGVTAKED